jgi:hypothetical protein
LLEALIDEGVVVAAAVMIVSYDEMTISIPNQQLPYDASR